MSDIIKTGATILRKIIKDKHITIKDLAQKLQDNGYNLQAGVLRNKLYRDTFTLNEYILIANALECDVKAIPRNGNIEYIIECDTEMEKNKHNNTSKKMKKVASAKKESGGLD